MTPIDFQRWLAAHGQAVIADGMIGPKTRQAILDVFANPCAEAVGDADIALLATRLGCSTRQLRAVARVESGGTAYDATGKPKMLFERHKFHHLTNGAYSVTNYSNPKGGGYEENSWNKLAMAAGKDAEAAFAAASWGKFQVLGMHWRALGYPSPLELAYSTVTSEAAHYEMLARYVEHFGLKQAIGQISTDPKDNEMFARLYNGPQFKNFAYDQKLAKAMA